AGLVGGLAIALALFARANPIPQSSFMAVRQGISEVFITPLAEPTMPGTITPPTLVAARLTAATSSPSSTAVPRPSTVPGPPPAPSARTAPSTPTPTGLAEKAKEAPTSTPVSGEPTATPTATPALAIRGASGRQFETTEPTPEDANAMARAEHVATLTASRS